MSTKGIAKKLNIDGKKLRSLIMKTAWAKFRKGVYDSFRMCLRAAWYEARQQAGFIA